MKNTNIEWTDHSVNFWWGCTKVSPACANCYAESVAKVFGRRIFGAVPQWGAGKPRAERLEKARLEALALNRQAEKKGTRYRVFVNSMSDWLDGEVPIEWLSYLLETLSMCPNLDFQLLTKRPENWDKRIEEVLKNIERKPDWGNEFSTATHPLLPLRNKLADWFVLKLPPPNVWIGTTVENQEQAEKRIPHLLKIPARVRFLSCEPLLGIVDLRIPELRGAMDDPRFGGNFLDFNEAIHWVITGGESGGRARPMHPDWVRSLRDQCAAAHVPFFFKQWGEWCPATEEFRVHGSVMPESGIMPCGKPAAWVDDDGKLQGPSAKGLRNPFAMARMGSKHTGRLLEGVEHSAFPA